MPKRNDKNFVFDDGEDDDREDSVAIIDDDEANEDLSLKILEKALSRRDVGNKLDSDLSDSGVVSTVIVNGGTSKGKNAESTKKMKRNKLEAAHEIPIVWKDQYVEKVVDDDVLEGEKEDDEVEKSAEPKTGETSSNLVMKKLLRGARYFDPSDAGWGHACYICNKGGHRANDCPDKYKSGSKGSVCLRCGGFGHDMILCKYEYSQEDLKDIQCYVCKSFGHLCCIEPGNSLSWAVSCYRCGQLGHTALACRRHYDEINENDSVSPSCSKCGGEGHFKRDCPNPCSVRFPENSREASASLIGCREEEHFSRECPNSLSIRTSWDRDSPSLCYKCKGAGHFARECPNSSQDKWDIHLTRNFNLMQCIDQLLSQ